jgi:RecB family exonuclease
LCGTPATSQENALFEIHLHGADEIAGWQLRPPAASKAALLEAVSKLGDLPADEPTSVDDPEVQQVLRRVDGCYPHLASTSVPATIAASQLGAGGGSLQQPATGFVAAEADPLPLPASRYSVLPKPKAALRGTLTHRVLQRLNFGDATNERGVARELQRLVDCGALSPEERALIDEHGLAWLVSTPLAEAIRAAGDGYHREFKFVGRERVDFFDRTIQPQQDDYVLVRGIVDGIIVSPQGIKIVDFKTDQVSGQEVHDQAEKYRPQVILYARAAGRMFRRPVLAADLVFLAPRLIVSISGDFSDPI